MRCYAYIDRFADWFHLHPFGHSGVPALQERRANVLALMKLLDQSKAQLSPPVAYCTRDLPSWYALNDSQARCKASYAVIGSKARGYLASDARQTGVEFSVKSLTDNAFQVTYFSCAPR